LKIRHSGQIWRLCFIAEETAMPPIDPRQTTSISRFLATSRVYLGLPERRHASRPAASLRWLRLALVAGSVGSLFGGTAMAEHSARNARTSSGATQIAAAGQQTPARSETMP
jgi:2-iminoacetate synthase ThiH